MRYGPTSLSGLLSCSLIFTAVACGGGSPEATAPKASACEAPADLVLAGGAVMTMDPERPTATALAVRGNRVVAVGSDGDVRAFVGEATRFVALDGRAVTPGLIDAHAHLYGLGTALESVDLKGNDSEQKTAEVVAAAAKSIPPGEWITGRGWDQTLWTPAVFPKRATLDALVPDHPVAVRRVDGHALWANTKAIELAGVTRHTKNPSGGKIERDASGEPTGVFVDNAMDLIESKIPEPPADARRRRIQTAAALAISKGLTGVQDMGISMETVDVYRELAADGELPIRVYAFLSDRAGLVDELPTLKRYIDPDGMFNLRGIKAFADGALGSRGAALLAPYSDDPTNRGLPITEREELTALAVAAAKHGWQLVVHAIGDLGNRNTLDAFEAATQPGADLRFRVEHAQVVALEDIPRFAKLGVIASMQPTHATSDMRWAEQRVGPERIKGAYAWRMMLEAGARIAGGSDFPVEGVSPLLGIYAAVTRQDADGNPEGGWYPDQRLTLDEAIRIFTADAAYARFAEDRLGVLRPGMLADIAVFDRALAPDRSLLDTQVEMTIVDGHAVFTSDWAREKLAGNAPSDVLCR